MAPSCLVPQKRMSGSEERRASSDRWKACSERGTANDPKMLPPKTAKRIMITPRKELCTLAGFLISSLRLEAFISFHQLREDRIWIFTLSKTANVNACATVPSANFTWVAEKSRSGVVESIPTH